MEFDWMLAVKAAITAALGAFSAFWGWLGWLIAAWVVLMALDYATGTAAAMKNGEWASHTAREGIWHKMGEVVVVIIAAFADGLLSIIMEQLPMVEIALPEIGLLLPLVLVWYAITELGSIAENAQRMGAPIPAWLVKLMANGKDAVDAAGDKLTGGGDNEK
ncbi:MAG TPA: phage holin family protein [Candidatus Avoscillospira avistercoris]|uniref:Phage holin family protein n=1 Tax=Candidatus Avoscillospira avistercoris TaxID=2840707 RepID=A0A9D1F9B1_9FIRM|nr:phage holin family protein [Candidatus Avoscillospira avistercoris]